MTERASPSWVVDTNLLISRLLVPGGTAARAVDHAVARGVLLLSAATLNELIEVIGRPKFDPYISDDERRQFVALLGGIARLVPIRRQFQACRDPRDDKFLDVAIAGTATALITGDKDLLVIGNFHGVEILAPAAFLERWPA